jgi:hypothetical protein
VRNHRKTKYDDDTHFDHHHRAGDFEQQLFSPEAMATSTAKMATL